MSSNDHQPNDASPGDKSKKYDRQLRLWGDHGQAALETAKVCLINVTATGTEILKNLILPGVGSFTIVDGTKVSGEDAGNNFFLDKDSIGKSKAKVATELLSELNEDVNGDFVEESTEDLLENNSAFFTNFTLVIACDLIERYLLKLSGILWEHDIPLMVCRSYGFIGYLRLVTREHPVVESHPDNAHEDLRLDKPFPGLIKYCDAINLESLSKKDHSHTPWLVIIYKYLQQWKAEHGGEGPKNYKEKSQLKECIRQGIRKRNEDGVPEDEENFDEAMKHLNASLVPTRIPDTIQSIFCDEKCIKIDQDSKPFWILTRAVKEFVGTNSQGTLPLRGSIPDMTADSERYISLQNVYKDQANQDIALVSNILQQILQNIGRPQDLISESDIKSFCKNISFLRVLRCRPLSTEYEPSTAKVSEIGMHLEDEDSDLVYRVLLRAADRFHAEYNRYPGYYNNTFEADIPKLKVHVVRLLQEWGLTVGVKDEYIHEFCRYGASELHSVAAYMGGVAAQEGIKLITNQFIPINNTYLYNAMKQTSMTIEL